MVSAFLEFLSWMFIGIEKGKLYSDGEMAIISTRRGVGIGLIIFAILLICSVPPLSAFGWALVTAMMAAIFGMVALD